MTILDDRLPHTNPKATLITAYSLAGLLAFCNRTGKSLREETSVLRLSRQETSQVDFVNCHNEGFYSRDRACSKLRVFKC